MAVLTATLAAHIVAAGELALVPTAPMSWGWIVLGALVLGPRRVRWRPRRPIETLGLLCAGQTLLHLLLTAAPWSLGLAVHHPEPWLTPGALAAHAAAALAMAALVQRAEGLLDVALRVVRRVRRMLAPRMVRSAAPLLVVMAPALAAPPWGAGARVPGPSRRRLIPTRPAPAGRSREIAKGIPR